MTERLGGIGGLVVKGTLFAAGVTAVAEGCGGTPATQGTQKIESSPTQRSIPTLVQQNTIPSATAHPEIRIIPQLTETPSAPPELPPNPSSSPLPKPSTGVEVPFGVASPIDMVDALIKDASKHPQQKVTAVQLGKKITGLYDVYPQVSSILGEKRAIDNYLIYSQVGGPEAQGDPKAILGDRETYGELLIKDLLDGAEKAERQENPPLYQAFINLALDTYSYTRSTLRPLDPAYPHELIIYLRTELPKTDF